MNDEHLFETDPDGWKLRACIFESKYVPLGYCRYQIDIYVASIDWWYRIEESFDAWLWPDAQIYVKDRLKWWSENWRDMPVVKQIT